MDRNWNAAEKSSFGVLAIFFFLTSIRLRKLNLIKVHRYDFFCFYFVLSFKKLWKWNFPDEKKHKTEWLHQQFFLMIWEENNRKLKKLGPAQLVSQGLKGCIGRCAHYIWLISKSTYISQTNEHAFFDHTNLVINLSPAINSCVAMNRLLNLSMS